jgi:hypothetical protein
MKLPATPRITERATSFDSMLNLVFAIAFAFASQPTIDPGEDDDHQTEQEGVTEIVHCGE